MPKIDYKKIFQRFANSCGINSRFISFEEDKKKLDDAKYNNQYSSFSEIFTYKYYDEINNIIVLEDSQIGCLIELNPLVGIDDNTIKELENLLDNIIPKNMYIQILIIASANIDPLMSFWKSKKNHQKEVIKKIIDKREKFLQKKSSNFIYGEKNTPRDFRLYISVNQKSNGRNSQNLFCNFQKLFLNKLSSIGLAPRLCNADCLINLVNEICEIMPRRKRNYDSKQLISKQIMPEHNLYRIEKDRIIHEGVGLSSKFYIAREEPAEFSLSYMIKLLGDDHSAFSSIPGRFIISFSIANDISNSEANSILQKGSRIINSSEEWYSRNNREIQKEAIEWRDVSEKAKNGQKFYSEFFQIMLTCDSNYMDEIEQNLISLYNSYDWKLEINKYFNIPALISIMPMQSYILWNDFKYFRLCKNALTSEICAKLPIHAEWKGVSIPGMILLGRRGQLFNWNPFYRHSSGNYNICIFGPSGSGKSVFLQELAISLIAQNTKVFILDIGKSFKNICMLLDGEIVEFGQKSDIELNPFYKFSKDLGEEEKNLAISYAKNIVCSMCGVVGDSLSESILEKTIIKGIEEFGENFDITKLVEILEENDNRSEASKNLALRLFSYSKEGIYGKFFLKKSDSKISRFEKDITIFEFEEIKNNKLLLSVVLQIIGLQIFMQILLGKRDRKFLLIVDEAWMILDHCSKFLSEFARTIRKYGGSIAVCVQNYSDLEGSDDRRAILQNSTWTILLKQDEKGIHSFKNSDAFSDIIPLIKSISIEKNEFSEMLIYSTGIRIIGRLILDPFSKILYSTDSEIFSEIDKLSQDGLSLLDSIDYIADKKQGS